ncbi:MAG: hypothetical protein GXO55_08390 [Chloroflexi bacterium]|nr:hypothetical protein [Chloroflexota bacterium]
MNLPARWTSVELILQDVLYISYRLPADRVRPHLPSGISLATVGEDEVFVTALITRVERARLARLPSPRWSYAQVGIMTYVQPTEGTQPAVFCLRQGVTHARWARVLRWFGVPVDEVAVQIRAERTKRNEYTTFRVQGDWQGPFHVEARQVAPRLESLPPFPSGMDAVIYLVDALEGLYAANGRVYRVDMWHPRPQPRVGEVSRVEFPMLGRVLDLSPEEIVQPTVVLMAPRNHYLLHLPPRRRA